MTILSARQTVEQLMLTLLFVSPRSHSEAHCAGFPAHYKRVRQTVERGPRQAREGKVSRSKRVSCRCPVFPCLTAHPPSVFRKQMKPFTIRKQAQPSRAGAATGDASMDMSMKYATGPAGMGSGTNMMHSPNEFAMHNLNDETLLEQADLDRLAEEFPGKVPENPWIKEQTNKQYLTQIKVSMPLQPPLPQTAPKAYLWRHTAVKNCWLQNAPKSWQRAALFVSF
mmetsp:Transcript_23035/g.30625  ORF Transcript_23035/g.30625 Transcript_23035/m.30625 type:complete len:225 (-) Transcript_23035:21-695(-)